jgi:hypothetical protein
MVSGSVVGWVTTSPVDVSVRITLVSVGMVVVSVVSVSVVIVVDVSGTIVVSVVIVVDVSGTIVVSVVIVVDVSVINVSRIVVSAVTVVSLMPVIPWRVVVSDETPVVTLPVELSVTVVSAPVRVVVSYGVVSAPVDVVVSYTPCSFVTGIRCCDTEVVVSLLALAVSAGSCANALLLSPKANAAAAPIVMNFAECRGIIWSSSNSRPSLAPVDVWRAGTGCVRPAPRRRRGRSTRHTKALCMPEFCTRVE